jgi:hypothetical protein
MKLKYDELLSNLVFKFKLRPYIKIIDTFASDAKDIAGAAVAASAAVRSRVNVDGTGKAVHVDFKPVLKAPGFCKAVQIDLDLKPVLKAPGFSA